MLVLVFLLVLNLMQDQIKQKEADRILRLVKQDSFVITLEIKGQKMDSVQFQT